MSDIEIPLSQPDITELEIELVNKVMRSGRLSIGPMQERFESMVAQQAGTRHAVAVSSGTAGLHLVLEALGIGPGDEIITTPFSFIASSNCALFVGAKPVFVDICPTSLNMDPAKIEAAITPKTKAILAVETFGNPAHMNAYAAIAGKYEIPLIEDCCEALGASLGGRQAGSFGRAGVFAFYANKQITTGEGGMIVTDDDHLADACRSMRNQGRRVTAPMMAVSEDDVEPPRNTASSLEHVRLGYNYRLSEIHAAIGVAQMSRLSEILDRRREVAETYLSRLIGNPHLIVPTLMPDATMSWFLFVTRLAAGYTAQERDRIMRGMQAHEIGAAPYFPCIHLQPFYRERFGHKPGDFPIAESVSQRTLALPFFTRLDPREIELVVQTLELMIEREQLSRG